ncbi:MAG: UDP-N-acetylmuramoyl-L-alanine--D-glutamate ligase [Pseudomonadota bacterium]
MIPVQGYAGRRVGVLGLGRSGLATARALAAGGAEVLVWDDNPEAIQTAVTEGFQEQDFSRHGGLADLAALIVSPGIPHLFPSPHKAIAAAYAAGVAVDNDISLFFRSFATREWENFDQMPKVLAVTGSNGKSTTSALIEHILREVGRPCQLGGNIGRGVLDLDPAIEGEVVILELSSYQLELARALTPDIAVFTNFSADHLDRHGGLGGYFAAKRRLFAEGGPDRAVIGVDEPEGRYLAGQMAGQESDDRVVRISAGQNLTGSGWNVFVRKGQLAEWRKGRQLALLDLRAVSGLPGAHNHQNAAAAYAACRSLGLAPRVIESAFESFAGLPHRSQTIAEIGGVRYVNDSKATNVDAASKALQAFSKIRWICGGLEKEGGLDALAPHLSGVIKAYVIGREAEGFALNLGDTPREICRTMKAAVAAAAGDALPGETVLLAPAAASFDQYDNFEQRGDDFADQVSRLS